MVYSVSRILENTRTGSLPGSSLEDPLGHLVACHGRIEERLQILERVGQYLLDPNPRNRNDALDALRNSIRYFDTSGIHHTRDEEESLFPRLRAHAEGAALLAELEQQHRDAEQTYAALAECAGSLQQEITGEKVERFRTLVNELAAHYRPHIELENSRLIPLAAGCLSEAEIEQIRDEMRQRRDL